MSEEDAIEVMQPTIAVYAHRLHQRFQGYLVSWTVEDLQQEGRLAAALVARRFDPTRGAFQSYAKPRIWGAMVDYVRRVLPDKRQRGAPPMLVTDTLGLQAYAAYWRRWPATALPWEMLTLRERRCWDAAARAAVLAWQAHQTDEASAALGTREETP